MRIYIVDDLGVGHLLDAVAAPAVAVSRGERRADGVVDWLAVLDDPAKVGRLMIYGIERRDVEIAHRLKRNVTYVAHLTFG